MNDKILAFKIFNQIETIEEFEKVCRSIIFLNETVNFPKTTELYYESLRAFNRLTNCENHGN